jgi:hypothetical protein
MALLFSATDECSRSMMWVIPTSFSLAPQSQIRNIPKSIRATALLPCFSGAELNRSRCCHARKRIARECC